MLPAVLPSETVLTLSMTPTSAIDLVISGGKCIHGKGKKRIRLTLTYDLLLKIIQEADLDGINIECAICVAFAGFLRCGEFKWNSWESCTSSLVQNRRQNVYPVHRFDNLNLN